MAKEYDLSKKSDMRKFGKDLERTAMDKARKQAKSGSYDYECPNCGKVMKINHGKSTCPHCNETFDVDLQVNF